ncbi:hypothetical protein C5167_035438, partial [Papaver somniferum]
MHVIHIICQHKGDRFRSCSTYGNTYTVQSNTRAYWGIIEMAVRTVENTGGQYHVHLTIADVQISHFVAVNVQLIRIDIAVKKITQRVDVGHLILDWAWDMMREFDGNIPLKLLIIFR